MRHFIFKTEKIHLSTLIPQWLFVTMLPSYHLVSFPNTSNAYFRPIAKSIICPRKKNALFDLQKRDVLPHGTRCFATWNAVYFCPRKYIIRNRAISYKV